MITFRVIPVPIPNTEVKPKCAENTCGLPCWEDRLLPDLYIFLVSSVGRALGCKADRKIKEVSSSIRKLIDDKVAKSVELVTSNVDDNTEQGESYV